LAYGDYGNLLDISFAGLGAPVTLNFTMLDPVYNAAAPDAKYFTVPDGIEVNYEPFTAMSFPNPAFDFDPTFNGMRSSIIEPDPADPITTLLVRNVGGEHMPTLAALYWKVRPNVGILPGTLPVAIGFNYNGVGAQDTLYYLVNPELNGLGIPGIADSGTFVPFFEVDDDDNPIPGTYSSGFYIDVYYGSLFYTYTYGPYYLLYEVN